MAAVMHRKESDSTADEEIPPTESEGSDFSEDDSGASIREDFIGSDGHKYVWSNVNKFYNRRDEDDEMIWNVNVTLLLEHGMSSNYEASGFMPHGAESLTTFGWLGATHILVPHS